MSDRHSRRDFLLLPAVGFAARAASAPIDRHALVRRHNPVLTAIDPSSPLSVGNGEFAFTVDVTGLQSLPDLYEKSVPLCTQSQWGWHSFPMPGNLESARLRLENFDTYGRPVGYATSNKGQEALFNWLRENPHRLNLGRIGLLLNDRAIMRRTLDRVMREWRWADTWGWDFPMVALTAARLGEPETAIDALFIESPKNTWLPNGHDWQRPNLPRYLPGNGGLLTAVAMMACQWNGFPKRGWNVRWEGLRPLIGD